MPQFIVKPRKLIFTLDKDAVLKDTKFKLNLNSNCRILHDENCISIHNAYYKYPAPVIIYDDHWIIYNNSLAFLNKILSTNTKLLQPLADSIRYPIKDSLPTTELKNYFDNARDNSLEPFRLFALYNSKATNISIERTISVECWYYTNLILRSIIDYSKINTFTKILPLPMKQWKVFITNVAYYILQHIKDNNIKDKSGSALYTKCLDVLGAELEVDPVATIELRTKFVRIDEQALRMGMLMSDDDILFAQESVYIATKRINKYLYGRLLAVQHDRDVVADYTNNINNTNNTGQTTVCAINNSTKKQQPEVMIKTKLKSKVGDTFDVIGYVRLAELITRGGYAQRKIEAKNVVTVAIKPSEENPLPTTIPTGMYLPNEVLKPCIVGQSGMTISSDKVFASLRGIATECMKHTIGVYSKHYNIKQLLHAGRTGDYSMVAPLVQTTPELIQQPDYAIAYPCLDHGNYKAIIRKVTDIYHAYNMLHTDEYGQYKRVKINPNAGRDFRTLMVGQSQVDGWCVVLHDVIGQLMRLKKVNNTVAFNRNTRIRQKIILWNKQGDTPIAPWLAGINKELLNANNDKVVWQILFMLMLQLNVMYRTGHYEMFTANSLAKNVTFAPLSTHNIPSVITASVQDYLMPARKHYLAYGWNTPIEYLRPIDHAKVAV